MRSVTSLSSDNISIPASKVGSMHFQTEPVSAPIYSLAEGVHEGAHAKVREDPNLAGEGLLKGGEQ